MRIAVLSDVHSNLPALEAVLAAAGNVDAVWHLGDVVGYGPDPDGVVERLAGIGAVGVRGNHDTVATIRPEAAEWFNPDARTAVEWTRDAISRTTAAWLADLPEVRREGDWTLVHGSVRDPLWEYITSDEIARASFEALETPYALHGHTHHPTAIVEVDGGLEPIRPADGEALELDGRRALLNPGSVGQPRDGIPTASWLVLDTDAARAVWHRTAFDIGAVQAHMVRVGLPTRLVQRLSHGY
jgi:predicted phosphodiesterase